MENRDIFDMLSDRVLTLSLNSSEYEAGVKEKDIPGKPPFKEWIECLKK